MPIYRVGVFPDPFFPEIFRSSHNPLLKLMAEAVAKHGWEVVGLSQQQVLSPAELPSLKLDVLHLHWPKPIFQGTRYWPSPFRRLDNLTQKVKGFPRTILRNLSLVYSEVATYHAKQQIKTWMGRLLDQKIPLVWQIHDLVTHSATRSQTQRNFSLWLHKLFYFHAKQVIIHENSCLDTVEATYGGSKPYTIVPIGDYVVVHGDAITREEARRRLNLDESKTVLAYIGTARANRNPNTAVQAFLDVSSVRDRLIVAGAGTKTTLGWVQDSRVIMFDGMVPNETLRDILCAVDFVINDAKHYLTSAIVRAAISYGVPVVAYPFGSTIDMARGALIPIDDSSGGITQSLSQCFHMEPNTYEQMKEVTRARNKERTWEKCGEACAQVYATATRDTSIKLNTDGR